MADSRGNKFVCKFCHARFPCGKSLGGHIRVHKNTKPARFAVNQKERTSIVKLQISRDRRRSKIDSESADVYRNSSHGQREKPRIAQKFSDSRFTPSVTFCRECGKGFQPTEALCCHLASLSQNKGETRKLEEDESDSTEPLTGEEAINNAASILMTLCLDPTFPGIEYLNSVAESSDNKPSSSHRRETVLTSACNSNGGFEMKEPKRRKLEVAESSRLDACKKVKLKMPVNGSVTNGECKKPEFKCGFSTSSSAESLKNSRKNEDDQVQTPSYKYELRRRSFNGSELTHQSGENSINTALNSNSTPAKELLESISSKSKSYQEIAGNEEKRMGPKKRHKCPICFKVFKSGQALGGHKRSHMVGSSEDASMAIKQESSRITGLLDLNAPAPMEEEDEESSIWV